MPDLLERRVLQVVQEALRATTDDPDLVIGEDDSMETVPGWDSLTFMSVFLAVNDAFALAPDFDEAIHYTALPSLVAHLREQLAP
jgi:acyl carrier protein